MKGKKQNNPKGIPLLEKKGYERLVNEIVPVQQTATYSTASKKSVRNAVEELNPDLNSMECRG